MKNIFALILLFPVVALAGIEEYTVNGETRLYDSACYWNAPEKIAPSKDGGYNVIIPTTRDDCRVRGSFAKVVIIKRNLDYGTTSSFYSEWLPESQAVARKEKLDAEYGNELGLYCPSQFVEVKVTQF